MPPIDPDALQAVQPELLSNESVLWAGKPQTSVIFHKEDSYLIPFSLLWGGFAIFWEAGAAGFWGGARAHNLPSYFMMAWGIPFILIGQYLIWGRFFVATWKKRRTYYAATNRRAIVVQHGPGRKTASAYIDTLPILIKEGGSSGVGTLRFAQMQSPWTRGSGWGVWDGMTVGDMPVFRDIDGVDLVYRLISDQRERLRSASDKL